ncbi:GNAT family N-acetyltransferase [Candidatus Thioglobus sp.]|nr:GNAT family N-acetyltransferase [Candidatus Thioglobus sp.]
MNYKFEECLDYNLWDDFVINSPQSNIYCCSSFLFALSSNFKLYFVRKNGNVLLGCIVVLDDDGNVSSPSMYQGVLFDKYISTLPSHRCSKITLDLIDFLLASLEKRFNTISFMLHYSINDIRSFQWFNYHSNDKSKFSIEPYFTGILKFDDIENFDSLLKKSRKVRLQDYNKSIKEGFKVSESSEVRILDELHDLTFARQGLKRNDHEKMLALNFSKIAIEKGFGRLMICRSKEGKPVSASLFLFDKIRGYYHFGATNPEYRNYGVGSFVMFHQLKRCLNDGLNEVDFIGINSPQRGDFKTSFNAEPKVYFTVSYNI